MTKTQTKLLERANSNSHGIVTVMTGFSTSRRRSSYYGSREHAAAVALLKAGKLKFLRQHKGIEFKQYGAEHYTEHVFEVVR